MPTISTTITTTTNNDNNNSRNLLSKKNCQLWLQNDNEFENTLTRVRSDWRWQGHQKYAYKICQIRQEKGENLGGQYESQDMRKAQSRTHKGKHQPEIIRVNRKEVASFTSRNFDSTFRSEISKQIFINVNKLHCYITLSLLVNKSSFYFNNFIDVIFFLVCW